MGDVLASHRRSLSTVRRSRNRRGSAFAIRAPPRSSSGRRWKRQVRRAVGVREHAGWRKCEEEESGSCNPSAPLSRYRRSATAVDASRIKHVHGRGAEGPAAPRPPPPLLARTLRPPRSFPRARRSVSAFGALTCQDVLVSSFDLRVATSRHLVGRWMDRRRRHEASRRGWSKADVLYLSLIHI